MRPVRLYCGSSSSELSSFTARYVPFDCRNSFGRPASLFLIMADSCAGFNWEISPDHVIPAGLYVSTQSAGTCFCNILHLMIIITPKLFFKSMESRVMGLKSPRWDSPDFQSISFKTSTRPLIGARGSTRKAEIVPKSQMVANSDLPPSHPALAADRFSGPGRGGRHVVLLCCPRGLPCHRANVAT